MCPGRYYAEQGIWLTIACILAAFEIKPPLDDDGCEYLPKIAFTTGTGRSVHISNLMRKLVMWIDEIIA